MLNCLKGREDPTYDTVIKELVKAMEKEKDEEGHPLVDESFSATCLCSPQPGWMDSTFRFAWIACFAVTGGSEGHWIHVDVYPSKYSFDSTTELSPRHLALGKTFKGWDHAWRIARRCAELLGA